MEALCQAAPSWPRAVFGGGRQLLADNFPLSQGMGALAAEKVLDGTGRASTLAISRTSRTGARPLWDHYFLGGKHAPCVSCWAVWECPRL